MKEIGDGSFGSVALARVRTAGSHIARRGTLVSSNDTHIAQTSSPTNPFVGCHQDNEEDV
jgi:hypothetical protein